MMRRLFSKASHLSPGVVDAGLASVATFGAGLAGVNLLGSVDRGVYGVFFTSFILGGVLISQLIYVPAQVVAVGLARESRLEVLRRSIKLALVPSMVGASAAGLAALLTNDLTTSAVIVALTVSTAATIVVSTMQDHVRQLLHIAEKSWLAASVSGTQLLAIAIAIPVMTATDVNRAWIPYGSLFIANVISFSVGVFLAGGHRRHTASVVLQFGDLVASGKWLVVRAAVPSAAAFAAANLLTRIAGAEAYGYAEAARQVAQPIMVLSLGLMAVMGPRAVRSASRGDAVAAGRNRRLFVTLVVIAGAGYVAVVGFDWGLNPMAYLVPSAYTITGLVAATILANVLSAIFHMFGREMLGAGHARSLATLAVIAAPALPLVAMTAGTTEAFARPIGYIIEGSIKVSTGGWWLRRHYANTSLRQSNDAMPGYAPAATSTSEMDTL